MAELLKILICGGRDLNHADVWNALERDCLDYVADKLDLNRPKVFHVIHGGAKGADSAAGEWAKSEGAKVTAYPANWRAHGKAAGPIRNRRMLDEGKPDVVVALPGGRGTADMIRQAEDRMIPVIELRVPV
jgi:hypothetical protein